MRRQYGALFSAEQSAGVSVKFACAYELEVDP